MKKAIMCFILVSVYSTPTFAEDINSSALNDYLDHITNNISRRYVILCEGASILYACKGIVEEVQVIRKLIENVEIDEVSKIKVDILNEYSKLANNVILRTN